MAARDANDEIIARRRALARAIVTRRSLRRADDYRGFGRVRREHGCHQP
jgi:hypothetical protein